MAPGNFATMRALLLFLTIVLFAVDGIAQQPCRMEITIAGAAGDSIYLASYYGNQLFYSDTAVADAKGMAVFARKSGYAPGLYAVLPGRGRFEVVVNEPLIKMATDANDLVGKLRVLESRENTIHHVERKAALALPDPERTQGLFELANANKGTFAADLIRMELEPGRLKVQRPDGTLDSAATADRMRTHYWDYTDLQDERLVHAPVFQNRLEVLLATGVAPNADAITSYLDSLLARCGKADALHRFILSLTIKKYQDQPTQGLGGVAVRLAQRYVCTGPARAPAASWLPADEWRTTCAQAARKATLITGAKSREIVLADTSATKWVSLHKMLQSCLVVVFWSPHCGHCKQSMPLLHEKYLSELTQLDVGIYAVAAANDSALFTDWKRFIRENHLDWVNVGVPWPIYREWRRDPSRFENGLTTRASINYAETWEAVNTPQFYVLDRDRRIVAKPSTLNELFDVVKSQQAKGR